MSTKHLRNISLDQFRQFLKLTLCEQNSIKGGHEKWTRKGIRRPIILHTHISPLPEFIIKNTLRTLEYSKEDFFAILENEKEVVEENGIFLLKEINN